MEDPMKTELLERIKHFISTHHEVPLTALTEEFHISMSTVRRYIDKLTEDSKFQKFYGGIRCTAVSDTPGEPIPSMDSGKQEKMRIGRVAAGYIEAQDIIYIDSGSTTQYLLDYVPLDMEFTVITHNYRAIQRAVHLPHCTLIGLPGLFDRNTEAFIGEGAASFLATFSIHKAFMACTGITIKHGATNTYSEEYATKSLAARKSRAVFLLADHRKFGISILMTYCPAENIQTIITDKDPSHEFADQYTAMGNSLIIA